MTEKRFSYEIENFKEELGQYNRSGLVKLLLMMKEENEQLKESKKELQFQLNICADHRNEFHRVARENGNCVGKLEKENEQLKRRNKVLREDLEQALKELGDD